MSSLRPVTGTPTEVERLLLDWAQAADPAPITIATSGSTGEPKWVRLTRAAMDWSVTATHQALGGPGNWEGNLPVNRVAGLMATWRTLTDPGPRRYTALVPTQLVRALADPTALAGLAEFDAVLVGGGPLAARDRAAAEAAGVRVVQTYGMSETCGGCVYDGLPLAGVELRIVDHRVQLKTPSLADGYAVDPAGTPGEPLPMDDGWYVTGDLGHIADDGRLVVDGRADDVIISGGVNVPPAAVERMLLADPAIREVAVVGRPDPEWGEVAVAVVAGAADLAHARDLVTPREWAPRDLVIVESLPVTAAGKPDRARLREIARG